MDGREAMSLPGAPSYYMQSVIHGTSGFRPLTSHQQQQQQHMPVQSNLGGNSAGSPFSPPVESTSGIPSHGGGGGGGAIPQGGSVVKRKRGRPRKYGADGGNVSLALSPISSPPPASSPNQKRGRGRPPGTGRKQQLASLGEWISGSAGNGFTPHIITIAVGEDIAAKIMSFSQQGPRAVCILSANGAVSTVTLRQPATSSGAVTYEGRFEILCLSGTYVLTDNGGSRGRSGSLSISLSSPNGQVIGGGVGGVLIAATPVQVVVGSFIQDTKTKNKTGDVTGSGLRSDIQPTDGGDHKPSTPPSSNTQHQNMAPCTAMNMNAGWPGSADRRGGSAHFDIDLTRG